MEPKMHTITIADEQKNIINSTSAAISQGLSMKQFCLGMPQRISRDGNVLSKNASWLSSDVFL